MDEFHCSIELKQDSRDELTSSAIANYAVQDGDKFKNDTVDLIKSSQDSDDIGAWISVLLGQDTAQKARQSL